MVDWGSSRGRPLISLTADPMGDTGDRLPLCLVHLSHPSVDLGHLQVLEPVGRLGCPCS